MKFRHSTIAAAVMGVVISLSSSALSQDMEQALKALNAALPGTLIHNPYDLQWEARGPNKKMKVVDAPETPTGKALSARVTKKANNPWDVALFVDIEGAVKSNEKIEAHFWARTKKPRKGMDTADITLFIGQNKEPYDSIISEDIKPGTEWKLHTVRGMAQKDFSKDSIKAEFQLGRAAQTIEFGPIYISKIDVP